MRRLAVLAAVVAAAVAAVLAVARDDPALRVAASAPVEPCAAGSAPGRTGVFRRTSLTLGPLTLLEARGRLPRDADLRALVAPGVAVRLRVDGARFADGSRERRLAACPPQPLARRAERVLGHRLVALGLRAARPACARLSVEIEGGGIAQSRPVGLGRDCAGAATGGAFAGCDARVEPVFHGAPAIRLGPLGILGLGPAEGQRSVKFPVMVAAGAVVTLRFGGGAGVQAGGTRQPARAVTYVGCPADEPLFSEPQGTVGPRTGFAGALTAPRPGCVPVEARFALGPPLRARLPVGVERC